MPGITKVQAIPDCKGEPSCKAEDESHSEEISFCCPWPDMGHDWPVQSQGGGGLFVKWFLLTNIYVYKVVPENREEIETNIRTALSTVCDPDDVEVDLKNAVSNLDMGFQVWSIVLEIVRIVLEINATQKFSLRHSFHLIHSCTLLPTCLLLPSCDFATFGPALAGFRSYLVRWATKW